MIEVTAWPEIAGPGTLQIRRVMRPGMGFPIPHVHLDMDEKFTIEAGVGTLTSGTVPSAWARERNFSCRGTTCT